MTHVAVKCPDCGHAKVINGRGTCRCGAYLVHHWNGMSRGKSMILRNRRVWIFQAEQPPLLLDRRLKD